MFLLSESEKPLYISLRAKDGTSSRKCLRPSCRSLSKFFRIYFMRLLSRNGYSISWWRCLPKEPAYRRMPSESIYIYFDISIWASQKIYWESNVFCSLLWKRPMPLLSIKIYSEEGCVALSAKIGTQTENVLSESLYICIFQNTFFGPQDTSESTNVFSSLLSLLSNRGMCLHCSKI